MNKIFSAACILLSLAFLHSSNASPAPLWYPAGYYRAGTGIWVKKPVLKYYFFAIKIDVDGRIGGKCYVRTYSGIVSHARYYPIKGKYTSRPRFKGSGAISRVKIRFGDGTRILGVLTSKEPTFGWLHQYVSSPNDIASTSTVFRIRFTPPRSQTLTGKLYGAGGISNAFTGYESLGPDPQYNGNYGF